MEADGVIRGTQLKRSVLCAIQTFFLEAFLYLVGGANTWGKSKYVVAQFKSEF